MCDEMFLAELDAYQIVNVGNTNFLAYDTNIRTEYYENLWRVFNEDGSLDAMFGE